MKHKLPILITGLLIILMVGFTQNQKEKKVLHPTQQSMFISTESMNNDLTYDEIAHTVLSEKGEFNHTAMYNYDHFEANIVKLVVDVLQNESNMTKFASTDNDKYCGSNG